jgi:GT2 family glycosyltransferase
LPVLADLGGGRTGTGGNAPGWQVGTEPGLCHHADVALETAFDAVVVTHNDAETLPACLRALRSLDPAPHRTLIIDNASTDRSPEIAEDVGAEVHRCPRNSGFAGGMNRGFALSDAPWVLSVNPDCALGPDFVGRLLAAVEGRPEADETGSATGLLLRARGPDLEEDPRVDAAGMVVTPSGRHFDRAAGETMARAPSRQAWVFGGTGAATLYRKAALEDVAYPDRQVFPESFFAYREDAELAWRLQWRGWRCLYVPEARAHHRRGFRPEDGRRGRHWINRHSVKNRFLMRLHCADLGWHVRCFPWWWVRDLAVVGACLTIETSSLPALAEAWRWRRDGRRRRRWVLDRARVPSRQVSRWFRKPSGWADEVTAE